MDSKFLKEALTFDDVLLIPQHSKVHPRDVLLGEEKNVFSLPSIAPLFPDDPAHTLVVVNTEKGSG